MQACRFTSATGNTRSKALNAIERAFFHRLTLSKASLSGWQAACPGRQRMLVPEDVVFQMGNELLSMGEVGAAVVLSLQMECFAAPWRP